ncbi:hypothetical protein TUM12370_22740 [Salmonella enterica subsp. enterica serovar Choleraesuis]|nr:hypothetical protein TUM12370_22740 [Salmonella enterica subsp. enterica serovar Choleraesuis]
MLKYAVIFAGLLLTGCSHSGNPDSSAPPPATMDAYCQQDGNILSVQAPQGSSTRCEPQRNTPMQP